MHPIERLRYVARAGSDDPVELATDAAHALGAFDGDPVGLVQAARRLVARHPTVGPLWWTCSRVLVSPEPMAEGRRAATDLDEDPTSALLTAALPDGARVLIVGSPSTVLPAIARRGDLDVLAVDDGTGIDVGRALAQVDVDVIDVPTEGLGTAAAEADVVLIEAELAGPDAALCAPGSLAASAVARSAGRSTWLVTGRGRVLPGATYAAALAAAIDRDEPWEAGADVVPVSLVERAVGPDGPAEPSAVLALPGCPLAPELLKPARTPGSHQP